MLYFMLYIDILGFEERAALEAVITGHNVADIRDSYINMVIKRLEQLKNERTIIDSKQITIDSWLLISVSPWRIFESIKKILKSTLKFEMVVGVNRTEEIESIFTSPETIKFLKKDKCLDNYKKWYKKINNDRPPDKTFILLNIDAYKEFYFKQAYSKPYISAEYYLVRYEEIEKLMIVSYQYNIDIVPLKIQLNTGNHRSFIKTENDKVYLKAIFNIENYNQFDFKMDKISMDVYYDYDGYRRIPIDRIENNTNIPIFGSSQTGCSVDIGLSKYFVDKLGDIKKDSKKCYIDFLLENIKIEFVGDSSYKDATGNDRLLWSIGKNTHNIVRVQIDAIQLVDN